jgi:hypothetical protein
VTLSFRDQSHRSLLAPVLPLARILSDTRDSKSLITDRKSSGLDTKRDHDEDLRMALQRSRAFFET